MLVSTIEQAIHTDPRGPIHLQSILSSEAHRLRAEAA